jgi:hypothetical protein
MTQEIVNTLINHPWFAVAASVIALASAVASVTPTPKPGTFLAKVYAVIDFLALNIGKAKDKGTKDK